MAAKYVSDWASGYGNLSHWSTMSRLLKGMFAVYVCM